MEVLKILAGPDGEVARAALYHLISYYEDIGDEATARALTDRLLSGEDDFYSMKVLWRMGWKAWKNEDHSRAAEHFKRASALTMEMTFGPQGRFIGLRVPLRAREMQKKPRR